LISGHDGFGNRPDLDIYSNYAQTGGTRFFFMRGAQNIADMTTFNNINIQGFRDVTAFSDIYTLASTTIVSSRHMTVEGIRSNNNNTSARRAAMGSTSGVGMLTVNGVIRNGGYTR